MEKTTGFNLNTLDGWTDSLCRDLGFTYIGENNELLAIYSGASSVIVYDEENKYRSGILVEFFNIHDGKRDEFLQAFLDGKDDEEFPEVLSQVYSSVAEMLEFQ